MAQDDWLADRFEQHRSHLRAVAYRMLGSASDADDAVQEAWIRLSRSDSSAVENLGGWLTTVVARVALDMLRSRTSRREEPVGEVPPPPADTGTFGAEPERAAELADSLGPAMLVVLETLSPAERIAFVLHDMFAVPFDEIAPIVGRSPAAGATAGEPRSPPRPGSRCRSRRSRPCPANRRGFPGRVPQWRFRSIACAARSGRRAVRRRRCRAGGRVGSGRRRQGRRRVVLGTSPSCATGLDRWATRSCLGAWRKASGRLQLHSP